ncbi:hypothetical protein Nps_00845 [Candidatus Nanopusillus acidilobi]|nr:hypothetical protein Nps_00845 [Candidatus Nanopusillus acidilobi]
MCICQQAPYNILQIFLHLFYGIYLSFFKSFKYYVCNLYNGKYNKLIKVRYSLAKNIYNSEFLYFIE